LEKAIPWQIFPPFRPFTHKFILQVQQNAHNSLAEPHKSVITGATKVK